MVRFFFYIFRPKKADLSWSLYLHWGRNVKCAVYYKVCLSGSHFACFVNVSDMLKQFTMPHKLLTLFVIGFITYIITIFIYLFNCWILLIASTLLSYLNSLFTFLNFLNDIIMNSLKSILFHFGISLLQLMHEIQNSLLQYIFCSCCIEWLFKSHF